MMLKDLATRFYHLYLSKRWNLSWFASGALMDDYLYDYSERKLPLKEILRIHRKGFAVYDWCYCGITHETSHQYLSNADYVRPHPYNGEYSKWVDDKLTMKHVCAGTIMDPYMPAYYYHIDAEGNILCLMDCPKQTGRATAEDIADLTKDKGALAIKLMDGAVGDGFFKAEFTGESYALNGEALSRDAFCSRMGQLRNYLITEYFYPHPQFARYCTSTPGCIRYAACRVDGELKLLTTFLRLGTTDSGYVENYGLDGAMCLVCPLDENGHYSHGSLLDPVTYQRRILQQHPDAGILLEGQVPHWDQIQEAVRRFGQQFPQLVFLGFDFVITADDRVKILEINSLSSLDCLQEEHSVYDTPAGPFFRDLMKK